MLASVKRQHRRTYFLHNPDLLREVVEVVNQAVEPALGDGSPHRTLTDKSVDVDVE